MSFIQMVYIPVDKKAVQYRCMLLSDMTVNDVLVQSGWFERYPEIKTLPVGIFSTQVELDTIVKAGDRIEIYRPLTLDPMEKRRRRAVGGKTK